ncbi:DUF2961 domain-containing protein [Candidatus Sumerlaeota bacterium]|nr:DUF2961 domain-containing protein [Candidatus Sumerlaeota bacterium]
MNFNHLRSNAIRFVFFCLALPTFGGLEEEIKLLGQFDRLAEYRTGSRVEQISSYDRTGGNDDGFSGKYSYIAKEGNNLVIADLKGPGVIHRIWTPTPTDRMVAFYFDGETSPRIRVPFIDLFSGKAHPFLVPFCGHELGGYYCYFPIPYKQSCKIVYEGQGLMFHQILYRTLPPGETTESYPIKLGKGDAEALGATCVSWLFSAFPGGHKARFSAPEGVVPKTDRRQFRLTPGMKAKIFDDPAGWNPFKMLRLKRGGRLTELTISPASAFSGDIKDVILRAYWDGDKNPAIECPVSDFFGFAFGQPSMQSMLIGTMEGVNYCNFPMPYDKSARIELEYLKRGDADQPPLIIESSVSYCPGARRKANEGKFYAVWRREKPKKGEPYTILDAAGRGHFVGCVLQAQGLEKGMTVFFEGDDVATIDGEMRVHGTGSEDAFNGGWYALADRWDETKSLPTHGCLTYSIPLARTGAYRLYIGDKMSFEKSFNYTIEHGGEGNSVPVDYTSVAYYYADHGPDNSEVPGEKERTVYQPRELEFWLQLLPIRAFSNGSKIAYGGWRDPATKQHYETLTLTPAGRNAFMKVEVEVPAAGEYEVYLSYLKGPSYGIFKVNNRQDSLCEPIDAFATVAEVKIEHCVGTVYFEEGVNSLTFEITGRNPGATGGEFALHRILLKRKPAPVKK